MKAVIMCGGMGSRLRPLTESLPKPLIKIANRAVLEIIIEKIIETGITDIYLSLGYLSNEIAEFCNGFTDKANIKYCNEFKPLGTAGGVKNCISKTEEDILILSGDNVFDIQLNDFIKHFEENDSDASICCVSVTDPREYGTVMCDDDGKIIAFIEKPTWEQAYSSLVNTGIYLIKGSVLEMIPENAFCDFANDIFPQLLSCEKNFTCYKSDKYWGDIGEFTSLKKISSDILDMKCKLNRLNGKKYSEDTTIGADIVIKAPCLIADNVKIGQGSVIGPYTVIDSNTIIGENTQITGCIIGTCCEIGNNCEILGSVFADNVSIKDNCFVEDNCVIGYGAVLGRFTRVLSDKKIWPGRRIVPESIVSRDLHYETPTSISFDVFGVSGMVYTEFSVNDGLLLGQAIASVPNIKRVGIGTDNSLISENYKNCTAAGLISCGAECSDFGVIFKNQAHFFSAYSSLDFFIFVSFEGDIISYSFFGKQGLPVSSDTAKKINNNFKFSAFNFCSALKCSEIIDAEYLSNIYCSYVKKLCGDNIAELNIVFETENKEIKKVADYIFSDFLPTKSVQGKRCLHFLYNKNASEMYVIDGINTYSGERILSLICELELAGSNQIIIPEDSPSFIEDLSENYMGEVIRVYDSNRNDVKISDRQMLYSLWAFDCIILSAKLIYYLTNTGASLDELFKNQNHFALRKSLLTIDKEASEIKEILNNCGEKKCQNDIFYTFENRKGRVRFRQLGNSSRVRILAESYDIESAKEISVFITKKIKECNIDKDSKKL